MKRALTGIGIMLAVAASLFVYCGPLQATVVSKACGKYISAYDGMNGDPTQATADEAQDIQDAIHMLATVNDGTDVVVNSPAVTDAQRITAITSSGSATPDQVLEVGQLFEKLYQDCNSGEES